MAFGIVFLDNDGDVWTVDAKSSPESERSLLFSRPSFVEPTEQRLLDGIPDCWPNCTGEELRAFLGAAVVGER